MIAVDGRGELLAEFEREHPLNEGDDLTLPDGTAVKVIELRDAFGGPLEWSQLLVVAELLDPVR